MHLPASIRTSSSTDFANERGIARIFNSRTHGRLISRLSSGSQRRNAASYELIARLGWQTFH
jgi:hypothetical protein